MQWTRIYVEEKTGTPDDDDVAREIQEETRPPGRNIAKDKRNGKGKIPSEFSSGLPHDDMQLYYDTTVYEPPQKRRYTMSSFRSARINVLQPKHGRGPQ